MSGTSEVNNNVRAYFDFLNFKWKFYSGGNMRPFWDLSAKAALQDGPSIYKEV